MRIHCPGLLVVLLLTGCAPLQRLLPGRGDAAEALARSVTIVRDEWGVPTIYAPTDAAAAFGLAWAQAEDNFSQIEDDYIHALGRASSYYGEQFLAEDLMQAALEVERLSLEEYRREPPARRAIWDAFALGLNYYMRVRAVQARVITRFDPWMMLALARALAPGTTIDGVRLGTAAETAPYTLAGVWDTTAAVSRATAQSSMWAIAPARTADRHALLLAHPYGVFFGRGQRYELHVHSDEGWHVRGFAALGLPVPRSGHNEHIAWSNAPGDADDADVYEVTFDHPSDSLMYRYDGAWRRAESWTDTVLVNSPGGVQPRVHTFRRTHHGPIVARRGSTALALRSARMVEGGAVQQWYAMGRAGGIDEFRAALAQTALGAANTIYADQAGSIYYVHGSAVPARDTAFDWSRPVDGSTERTEWRGYHALQDLPQLLNPPSGWLQNTGSAPFLATADADNIARTRYPRYMAPDSDHAGARAARRMLSSDSLWTAARLTSAAFDTHVTGAQDAIALLVRDWEEVGATNSPRAFRLDPVLDSLRAWNRSADTASTQMTRFALWQERLRSGEYQGAHRYIAAFEDMLTSLERTWGSTAVPWGELNRLQRVPTSGAPFHDDHHSLPVAGAPAALGIMFDFNTAPPAAGLKRRYGVAGHAAVSVVELGTVVQSRSIVPFGQSADPAALHYFDQAPLYVRGELKQAWFTRDDVMRNAQRVYHPGPAVASTR